MRNSLLRGVSLLLLIFTLTCGSTISPISAPAGLQITVGTDKSSYILREIVEISGTATFDGEPVQEGLVGIQVNDPQKKLVIRTVPLGPIHKESYSIEIISFFSCDSTGNLRLSFVRGEYAWFQVTVRNKALFGKTVLITINIYDTSLIPLGIGATQVTIAGDSSVTPRVRLYIDQWASNGTATAYANTYTNWPENGGYPQSPEESTNFAIVESEYVEDTPGQIPSPSIENGTYEMQFRLSPEPYPGTYTVKAAALYQGWATDFVATTFEVLDVTAPPWPSFVVKPPMAGPNYEITFDASSSSAEGYGDSITNYEWDFDDTHTDTGKIVNHQFAELGNYNVMLNVTDTEGFWNVTWRLVTIVVIHNVAIISISCLEEIYDNWEVSVAVTVKNKGTVEETFDVTLSSNSSTIGIQQVALGPIEEETLIFTWYTTGLTLLANYTLEAVADEVGGETDPTDNSLTYGPVFVRLLGDVIFNRKIYLYDATKVGGIYGSREGDSMFDIMADFKRNGKIDLFDAVVISGRYGTTY